MYQYENRISLHNQLGTPIMAHPASFTGIYSN